MASSDKHEALQPLHPSMAGKLDPVFEKLYNDNMANVPIQPIDLAKLRLNYSTLYSYGTGPSPEVGRIYDTSFALDSGEEIPLRVYEPDTTGPWPVHIDYHGGGWGLGDLETEAHICKHICKKANVVVVDVAYRLVPEVLYPAAITDSFAALKHVYEHGAERFQIRPDSISVGGVSAGACISLALAHLSRDANIPLRLVAAGTPTIDDHARFASPEEAPYESLRENQFAPTLNWGRLSWFMKLKWSSLPEVAEANKAAREKIGWFANLMDAPDFKNLARTIVYTAGADPLRDEGEAYARKLAENGNDVTMRRFPGVPHPFMHMDNDLWQGREFIEQTVRHIRLAHYDP
jgi:acetyl esterase/lipase